MAHAQAPSTVGHRYWTVPVGRAAIALVPAIVITFNRDHSALIGLMVFGSFAVASGLFLIVVGSSTLTDGRDRSLFLTQGIVGLVAGALALGFNSNGLGFFLYLVSVWAAVTGFLELYAGTRVRGRAEPARDWMFTGIGTGVLALLFLLLPPNAVVAVGVFGAYLVFLAIFLPISGLSLKWDAPRQRRSAPANSAPNDSDSP